MTTIEKLTHWNNTISGVLNSLKKVEKIFNSLTNMSMHKTESITIRKKQNKKQTNQSHATRNE